MGIPENIDSLLVKFDLKPESLAKIAGVSTATVSRWRTGQTDNIRKANLERICKALELVPDDILSSSSGLAAKEHGRIPSDAIPVRPSSTLVPLLGFAHMGEPCDEETIDEHVAVPSPIADRHPNAFLVHAQGGCMDNHFPHDALLLIDPDMEPVNGKPVLAETEDYGAVVRNYMRGSTTTMLSADSHTGEYPDIIAGPDDPPMTFKGRVVWYMKEKDER